MVPSSPLLVDEEDEESVATDDASGRKSMIMIESPVKPAMECDTSMNVVECTAREGMVNAFNEAKNIPFVKRTWG